MPRLGQYLMSPHAFAMKSPRVRQAVEKAVTVEPVGELRSRAFAARWRLTMCWLPQLPNRTDVRFWHLADIPVMSGPCAIFT